jgi:hypothetical protein
MGDPVLIVELYIIVSNKGLYTHTTGVFSSILLRCYYMIFSAVKQEYIVRGHLVL